MSYSVRSLPHDETIASVLLRPPRHTPGCTFGSTPVIATSRRFAPWILSTVVLSVLAWSTLRTGAQSAGAPAALPGAMTDGTTLLPNGWRIQPAGKHVRVGDLPLNLIQTPDSRYLIVTSNGLARPSFSVIDIANWSVKSTMALDNAWLGLVWHPDGTKLYSSGAGQNNVQEFNYADGAITRARTFALPAVTGQSFAGGLAISPDGKTLFVTRVFAQTVSAIDLASGQVTKSVTLPAEPYSCVVSADGRMLYVSLWGGARVQVYMLPSMLLLQEFNSEEHPNALVLSQDGKRLFVACGNSSSVWVFDTFSGEAIEQISMSLYPERASYVDAKLPGTLSGWTDPARLQRRLQRHRGRRCEQRRTQPGQRLRAHRLVSHRRDLRPRRQADLHAERQRPDLGRQTDRRRRAGAAAGSGVGAAGARSRHARRLYAPGARRHALHRRPQDEPHRPGRVADSAPGRRQLADQARLLHHSREPHLRLDPRRPEAG